MHPPFISFCFRFFPSCRVYFSNSVLLELQDFPQQVSKLKQCQYATAQKQSHIASKITWCRKRTKSNIKQRVSPDVTFTLLFLTIVCWLRVLSAPLVIWRSLSYLRQNNNNIIIITIIMIMMTRIVKIILMILITIIIKLKL